MSGRDDLPPYFKPPGSGETLQMLPKEISLSVLFYEENGQCVAHALEMDLCGCGDSPESAAEELEELVHTQIGFAAQMKDPSLIFKRAEEERFVQFQMAVAAYFWGELAGLFDGELGESDAPFIGETQHSFTASSMPFPQPTAIRERMGQFQIAYA